MNQAVLRLASLALGAATAARRVLTDSGVLECLDLPAPVVSVGNLAAGGTGKTPLVEHCARTLLDLGAEPVILSRGYGPKVPGEDLNDEGLVLRENLPGVPQRQAPNRHAAGEAALAAREGDCLLLDDGFQHLGLARDLDIVAVDARSPFTGTLFREGPRALRFAGVVVLTRAARASDAELEALKAEIVRHAPQASLLVTDHAPRDVLPVGGGEAESLESLAGLPVFAAAGIADPMVLVETLRSLGTDVVGHMGFPDHGLASAEQLRRVVDAARAAGAERIVVTQKDAVKLVRCGAADTELPVVALRIGIRILEGDGLLRVALDEALRAGNARAEA